MESAGTRMEQGLKCLWRGIFFFVGGTLLALLFALDAYLPYGGGGECPG